MLSAHQDFKPLNGQEISNLSNFYKNVFESQHSKFQLKLSVLKIAL